MLWRLGRRLALYYLEVALVREFAAQEEGLGRSQLVQTPTKLLRVLALLIQELFRLPEAVLEPVPVAVQEAVAWCSQVILPLPAARFLLRRPVLMVLRTQPLGHRLLTTVVHRRQNQRCRHQRPHPKQQHPHPHPHPHPQPHPQQ